MVAREDCFDAIARRTGRTRDEVKGELDKLDDSARSYEQRGLSKGEAYQRARDERVNEWAEESAIRRRNLMEDLRRAAERSRWYETQLKAGHPGELIMKAMLDGVNAPIAGGRKSIGAMYGVHFSNYVGKLGVELERQNNDKLFASREIEADVMRELHELNYKQGRSRGLSPDVGVTRNKQALEIARLIQKYQKVSITDLNSEGGWVKTYSGYITKSARDADKVRKAATPGPGKGGTDADRDAWINAELPRLDIKRTFGTTDMEVVRPIMQEQWRNFATGVFGTAQPAEPPVYGNIARKASEHRELHYKSAQAWLESNAQFGARTPTDQIIHSFDTAARQMALMQRLGSKPREGIEADIAWMEDRLKDDPVALDRFRRSVPSIRNLYNQFDWSNNTPAMEWLRKGTAITMAVNRWSKLGRAPFTHVASLPTKSIAGAALGWGFGERYGRIFSDLFRGSPGTDKRVVADLMLAGAAHRVGQDLARYDVADRAPGLMAKIDSWFFKYSGLTAIVDNSRSGWEVMAARHLGMSRDKEWGAVPEGERHELARYGFGEPEWKAVQKVAWFEGEAGQHYLLPTDADRLTDDDVRQLIRDRQSISGRALPITDDAIKRTRKDVGDTLHAFYHDQARYAVFEPSARARAVMFQGWQQSSPNFYQAAKLFWQFRVWPMEMFFRTWGRLIYGGGSNTEKLAGIAELVVASTLFGVFAEGLREIVQGQDPTARMKAHPYKYLTRGALRSGAGTIAGDYLLGEYDRHGFSVWGSAMGPTFGQAEKLWNLRNDLTEAIKAQADHSTAAGRKWRAFGTEAAYAMRPNLPMVDMWWTFKMFDYLVFYRLMESMNPGFIDRMQKRQKDKSGIEFLPIAKRVMGVR